jgi:hypothetical protein
MPRYSSFAECNSCDKAWTSVAISEVCFNSSHSAAHIISRIRGSLFQLLKFNCQQRESLTNIVVKLPADALPFLFLGVDQLAAYAPQHLFGALAVADDRGQ